ncbi:helix-turn-helix domain-containing protein [Rhodobacter sp. Har01]|uniref:helix-turn-helix domain-containing protein n=1 Tax=Rhodobacter sp. Har01 TaxID=2883999 RepID=UPI001D060474|nr:helix-turn-helix domain-containing protein [Rhodobacter sp. Har01]MCB6178103.1 helix-turn-helix domain-containing protein [Rhodobacter sp. Har01]
MFRATMQSPAWAALSSSAQALYPFIKLEWRGPKSNNNGRIRFSYRQAAEALGIMPNTAMRAFHDLQAKGFLVVTELGALGSDGDARGPCYEVTELNMPERPKGSGRALYHQWQEGRDFPVLKHHKNNPTGRNGRRIPSSKARRSHLQNEEETPEPAPNPVFGIFKMATFSPQPHMRPYL